MHGPYGYKTFQYPCETWGRKIGRFWCSKLSRFIWICPKTIFCLARDSILRGARIVLFEESDSKGQLVVNGTQHFEGAHWPSPFLWGVMKLRVYGPINGNCPKEVMGKELPKTL